MESDCFSLGTSSSSPIPENGRLEAVVRGAGTSGTRGATRASCPLSPGPSAWEPVGRRASLGGRSSQHPRFYSVLTVYNAYLLTLHFEILRNYREVMRMVHRTLVIPSPNSHCLHFSSFAWSLCFLSRLPTHLPVHPSSDLSTYPPTRSSIYPPVHLPIYLHIRPPIPLFRRQTVCPVTPKHVRGFPENTFLYNHRVPVAAKTFMLRRYSHLTRKAFSDFVDRVKRVPCGTNSDHHSQEQ